MYSSVVPPVPFPNTVVKHLCASSHLAGNGLVTRGHADLVKTYCVILVGLRFNYKYIVAVVVKRLTLRIVAPAFVGSIPTNRPIQGYSSIGRVVVSKTIG